MEVRRHTRSQSPTLLLAHGRKPRRREGKGLAQDHTAGSVWMEEIKLRFLLSDQSLEGPSPCRRVLRPHLWAASSAGNVCSWSRAGPPRGDCHPLGLAASWETLIRAASLRGPVRVAQPGSHVTSR